MSPVYSYMLHNRSHSPATLFCYFSVLLSISYGDHSYYAIFVTLQDLKNVYILDLKLVRYLLAPFVELEVLALQTRSWGRAPDAEE